MFKIKNKQHIIALISFQCQAINYAFLANAPKTKNKSNVPQKVEGQKLQITKKNNYKEEEKGEKKQKKGNEESKLGSPEASPQALVYNGCKPGRTSVPIKK